MSQVAYTITSAAKGPHGETLYLVEANANIVVHFTQTPTALWHIVDTASSNVKHIQNASTGNYLLAAEGYNTVYPDPDPVAPLALWFLSGTKNIGIAPYWDFDLALNIAGNSYPEGTHVIVFKEDGSANSRWTLTPAAIQGHYSNK